MRFNYLLLLLAMATVYQAPLYAMTCANAETGTLPGTPPSDAGRAVSTACGDGAEATGNQSTSMGSNTLAGMLFGNSDHSYSGDAAKLSLDIRSGGV